MPPVRQASFMGEISPELQGKTNWDKRADSLRTMRNWFPTIHGAAKNRAGTEFVAEVKDSTRAARFAQFIFSDEQSMLLVFNGGVVRFYTDGAVVVYPSGPAVGEAVEVSHPYADADLPRLRFAQSGDVITICHKDYAPAELVRHSNTSWTLADISFVPARYGHGFAPLVTEDNAAAWSNVTTYASGDYVTKGGKLYFSLQDTNLNNDPEAASSAFWALDIDESHPAREWCWTQTTALNDANGVRRESMPIGLGGSDTVAARKYALYVDRPKHITSGAGNRRQSIYRGRDGVLGLVGELEAGNSQSMVDDGATPDFSSRPPQGRNPFLDGPATEWSAARYYASGDVVTYQGNFYTSSSGNHNMDKLPTSGAPWTPLAAFDPGLFYSDGSYVTFGGTTWLSLQSSNTGHQPDTSPSWWQKAINYPSCVTYHDGRRVFGRTDAKPSAIMGSAAADIYDYDKNDVVETAGNAYEWSLRSGELEDIRNLVSMNALLALTGQAEWAINGDNGGTPISPLAINTKRQSGHGSSWLPALVVGTSCVYVQALDNVVRDLFFSYQSYTPQWDSNDLSALAWHLFEGHSLVALAYAAQPWKLIWLVRDDGLLISLTYDRTAQVVAWAQHTFSDGNHGSLAAVEDVCAVPEGNENRVYLLVNREMSDGGGGTYPRRYIERMASRYVPKTNGVDDLRQCVFLDAAKRFNGRNTDGTTTLLLAGPTFNVDDQMTCTSSSAVFAATDVGGSIVFDADGTPVRAKIIAYITPTGVTVQLDATLTAPQAYRWGTIGTTEWAIARKSFAVAHLLGYSAHTGVGSYNEVGVLADGNVVPSQGAGGWDVEAGTGHLLLSGEPAVDCVIGLRIPQADLELLDINGDKVRDVTKTVEKIAVELVSGSRGFWAGPDTDKLTEWKQRRVEDSYGVVAAYTGLAELALKGKPDKYGRIVVRQVDPLPITIVGITREVTFGGT